MQNAKLLPKKSNFVNIQGFILTELLVVIVIIGVLMSVLLVAYQGTRKSARDGKRKADLERIRDALEMYRADKGKYPPAAQTSNCTFCVNDIRWDGTLCGPAQYRLTELLKPYLPNMPTDPLSPPDSCTSGGLYKQQYLYVGSSNPYSDCQLPEGCDSYSLYATLEIVKVPDYSAPGQPFAWLGSPPPGPTYRVTSP